MRLGTYLVCVPPSRLLGMMIDSNAPVALTAEIRIAAPSEVVWDTLTNVEKWPMWHPAIRSVEADRAPGKDMTFRWRPGPYQIKSTVQAFDPQKSIGWTGRAPGIAARHVWTIRPVAQGAVVVRTDESMTGLLPRLIRRQLRKSVQADLDSWLRNLKIEAERQAASS
jgi:uncharacterized protein YndB with AHSA1/START domain